ncbi:MAG: CerR family C-terminal domain-containing protein [Proteobacteria bacterium]|nr:CerR family C-terminal domain-containing protein [Pseudomonadota bacterium]
MPRKPPLPTKERIIDVAGDIFGKNGFKAATIRQIATAAQANLAAVNYHFRDKEGLYRAVLEDTFSKGFHRFPYRKNPEENNAPDQQLRSFIRAMFHRFLNNEGWGGISGRGKLIAREFFEPTPAFEPIVDTYIKPHKEILVSIISDLSRGKAGMDKILPCAISIIGQCVYYTFAAPVIQRIAREFLPTQENIDFLADHVFWFSLGGIQQINTRPVDRKPHL